MVGRWEGNIQLGKDRALNYLCHQKLNLLCCPSSPVWYLQSCIHFAQ